MKYPNLELIEYKFLSKMKYLYPLVFEHYYPHIYMDVFRQTWASTALGFGGVGGSAMTDAYTTVVHVYFSPRSSTVTNTIEKTPEFHGVYFDGRLAYMIETEPKEEFFKDVKERNMASVDVAIERYYERPSYHVGE